MSNHLAVAAVTATLRNVLQGALDSELSELSASVTHVRPNAPSTELPTTGVNVFLYQVTPNAAARNLDLPTRRRDGTLLQRPCAALDLHFLLSFYGIEAQLEPQRLLGVTVRTLHARPVLERADIEATVSNAAFSFVSSADLAQAPELVRFTPAALSLEDLSKLWSVFFQTPYVLSVAYQASVVLLEAMATVGAAPLPVRTAEARAMPGRTPVIERVRCQAAPGQPLVEQPILAGGTLVLDGRELDGETTEVRFGNIECVPSAVAEKQVQVPLPASLRAGAQRVRIVHLLQLGSTPDTARGVAESNEAVFLLRPSIVPSVDVQRRVLAQLAPPVGRRQQVSLLLNELGAAPGTPPRVYRLEAPHRTAETSMVAFVTTGVPAGSWLVRVVVDGLESPLGTSVPGGPYDQPSVVLP
ncbi:MAG: DUF4255 domain-containing protein [Deltaproteobacteria bacterium]|nr:DUF4255 domain-containing protein [Deltaproteobacteria bacterium]